MKTKTRTSHVTGSAKRTKKAAMATGCGAANLGNNGEQEKSHLSDEKWPEVV